MDGVRLILASASPRRRELLTMTGIPYEVDAADVDEHTFLGARDAVAELSRRKAEAVALRHQGRFILGSDTLVAIHDRALGKPRNEEDAFSMLRMLSGNTHQVYTGVTVIAADGSIYTDVDVSHVTFAELSDDEIRRYIATGEPMDKAGAYAMQGLAGQWIEHVDGCPSGIIGLPVPMAMRLLKKAGFEKGNDKERKS